MAGRPDGAAAGEGRLGLLEGLLGVVLAGAVVDQQALAVGDGDSAEEPSSSRRCRAARSAPVGGQPGPQRRPGQRGGVQGLEGGPLGRAGAEVSLASASPPGQADRASAAKPDAQGEDRQRRRPVRSLHHHLLVLSRLTLPAPPPPRSLPLR